MWTLAGPIASILLAAVIYLASSWQGPTLIESLCAGSPV